VRNAVDHGIEPPEVRTAAGKPAEGTVTLSASHHGNQMVIEISDDGKGIDPDALRRRALERQLYTADELETLDRRQVLEIIFRPGFSTAERVTEVSGRGVGMDVVKQAIVTRLKGAIDIDSAPGHGSTFTLRLPLTLAIIQVVLVRAAGEVFAIPLDPVIRTFTCHPADVHLVQEQELVAVGGRQVPLIRLAAALELDVEQATSDHDHVEVILCEVAGELYGLACDHLLGKKEIVIKSLGDLLEDVPCAAGATLLGERCALILDVPAIVDRVVRRGAALPAPAAPRAAPGPAADAPHILLIEDSDVVRESLRRLLADGGYRCTVAVDGVEGLAAARREKFDLISTDVTMPRMDGYELTRALRATAEYKDTPIVMVTSRGERIDRVRGFDAGVDEYITKPHDRQVLLRVVRKLLAASRAGGRR
jgi:CheY-like chemotaxis protein